MDIDNALGDEYYFNEAPRADLIWATDVRFQARGPETNYWEYSKFFLQTSVENV